MLRLTGPGEATWQELGKGVRMLIEPGSSIHEQAARYSASNLVAKALEGAEILDGLGVEIGADGLLSRPGMVLGLSELLIAVELGVLLIRDWEGVGDADGVAQPPDRPWISQLFLLHPEIRADFWKAAFAHRFREEEEGNVSALSPIGSPAGAETIASDAGNSAAPARKDGKSQRPTQSKGHSAR